MYYGLIMLSVCMFGGNFVLNRQYQKESGSGLRETLLYTLLSAGAGLLILLGINGFRFEYTPFTLLIAILTAFNGIAFNFCGLRAMGSINLSLYSLFSMLGGMLLPFCAGIFFYGEKLTLAKAVCLVGILCALLCTVEKSEKKNGTPYYIGIFVFNGMSGVLTKIFEATPVEKTSAAGFSVLSALATVLLAGILFLPFGRKKQQSLTPRATLYAVGGGALNRFANFILVLSLAHVDASVQYPMITGGVMIVCTLSALLLGEKPSRREICSVVLAFLSLLAPLCIPI
jgi:drug/metabolite transporter (DMT)-like permease